MPSTMNLSDIDVVILCGGQGTRIRDHLPSGLPKCLADINGTPFLKILCEHIKQRIGGDIIFAAGYGYERLDSYLRTMPWHFWHWNAIPEFEILGTGGAIINALPAIHSDPFLIVNGDTICDIDFKALLDNHLQVGFPITVPIDDQYRNVGVYVVIKAAMEIAAQNLGAKFDLDEAVGNFSKAGVPVNWYRTTANFWDIGTIEGLDTYRCLRRDQPARMA